MKTRENGFKKPRKAKEIRKIPLKWIKKSWNTKKIRKNPEKLT